MNIHKLLRHKLLFPIVCVCMLGFLGFFALRYYHEAFSFSFVDEYFNMLAGYFMNQHYHMYSDFFYNRNPFMGYISYILQLVSHPPFLYQQISYHRMFVIAFSLGWSILLIARFRWVGVGFVLLYEYLKYYTFGFLFQGEALIVYPLVYTAGVLFLRWQQGQKIHLVEYIFVTLVLWFSMMTREVYAPLCALLYVCLLIGMPTMKTRIISVGIFTVFFIAGFIGIPLHDYWYQVFALNSQTVAQTDVAMYGGPIGSLLRSFGYPIFAIVSHFAHQESHYHFILVLLSLLFIALLVEEMKKRRYVFSAGIIIILGFAAIRPHAPWEEFYGSYRMTIWLGLFLFSILAMMHQLKKDIYIGIYIIIAIIAFVLPKSYLWSNPRPRNDQFYVSYLQYNEPGEVLRILKQPGDTLFVDGYAPLIFIPATVKPAYPGVFYFPVQYQVGNYTAMRTETFEKHPPSFYFRSCALNSEVLPLPEKVKDDYAEFRRFTGESCLYVHKKRWESVTAEQKRLIGTFGYTHPEDKAIPPIGKSE